MMARQNVRLPILTIEWVAPFVCVTDVVAWVSLGLLVAVDLTILTVVGSAVSIRHALGSIESAIRLELTEVGICTLEELTEGLPYKGIR
ncbi:MAG: hypothetical protein ACREIJ_06615 [Nitrospiraceae bacterium]